MVERFDAASARNAEPGIVRVSRALFGSSPEKYAVGFMAGFLQARGRLKVARELLRPSDNDGKNGPDEANKPGDMLLALFQRLRAHVLPVHLHDVIGDQDRLCLATARSQTFKVERVVSADEDRLAVNHRIVYG